MSCNACMFIVQPQKDTFKYNVQCTTDTVYTRYNVQQIQYNMIINCTTTNRGAVSYPCTFCTYCTKHRS